ncbi:uncharacterized protein TNCV_1169111 [Trichonephila clavipes]|uniref:Uncharacterized protein n=1 Tax=Trichonephila clavipes TaxID=2585209 RepID=A0A8X6SX61_TRICX|nr:uncharacterized protein TNCV_1169111 [Trichonephila clavipes]
MRDSLDLNNKTIKRIQDVQRHKYWATSIVRWTTPLAAIHATTRCLEIVYGTIATPTSARIVERVTVGSTSACRTILRSSLLVVFLVAPDPVFRAWVPSRTHYFQQFLTAHSERSTWPATPRVDPPAVFIPMIRPLSNSLNCEKCLLARLPTIGGLSSLL